MAIVAPQPFFSRSLFFGSHSNFQTDLHENKIPKCDQIHAQMKHLLDGKNPKKNNHKDTHTHKHSYNSNERKRRVKLLVCECKTSLQEDCAPKNLFGYWNLAPLKSQQRL